MNKKRLICKAALSSMETNQLKIIDKIKFCGAEKINQSYIFTNTKIL